jgi:vancomycin permeability regulator SanA
VPRQCGIVNIMECCQWAVKALSYAKQQSVSKQPVGSIVGAGAFIPLDLISKFHNSMRKHAVSITKHRIAI